jgi:hypothetical protein
LSGCAEKVKKLIDDAIRTQGIQGVMVPPSIFSVEFEQAVEKLVSFEEVLVDSTHMDVVLFARVQESALGRFPQCNFGHKTIEKCWYFGLKLFLAVSKLGVLIISFDLVVYIVAWMWEHVFPSEDPKHKS